MHLTIVFLLLFVALLAKATSDDSPHIEQRQAIATPKPAFTLTLLPTSGLTATTSITPAATLVMATGTASTSSSASESTTALSAAIDASYVANVLDNLLPMITRMGPMLPRPTATASLSIPANLQVQLYTAVPPTVLVQLMRASYRSSVAAEFAAGRPPSWFEAMSPELQTFVKDLTVAARTTAAEAPVQTAYGTTPGVAAPVIMSSAASPSAFASLSGLVPVVVTVLVLCMLFPALP